MRYRRSGTHGGDIVRMRGEGRVRGVVLLEDTVGEWKAYMSALALAEGCIGLASISFPLSTRPTKLSVLTPNKTLS